MLCALCLEEHPNGVPGWTEEYLGPTSTGITAVCPNGTRTYLGVYWRVP